MKSNPCHTSVDRHDDGSPIPYELTDDGACFDDDQHPVDSATRTCCGGIGGHAHYCLTDVVEDAHRKAVDAALAAQRVADMWPDQTGDLANRADFVAGMAETIPHGLAALHRALEALAVTR